MSHPLVISDEGRPRFFTDENFDMRISVGLRQRYPDLDLLTAQEAALLHTDDPQLLRIAQRFDRIMLSHDVNTMPAHFKRFLAELTPSQHSPGVVLVAQEASVGDAIEWIAEFWGASQHAEWQNLLVWLPLR